jgi:hypothetical protein
MFLGMKVRTVYLEVVTALLPVLIAAPSRHAPSPLMRSRRSRPPFAPLCSDADDEEDDDDDDECCTHATTNTFPSRECERVRVVATVTTLEPAGA